MATIMDKIRRLQPQKTSAGVQAQIDTVHEAKAEAQRQIADALDRRRALIVRGLVSDVAAIDAEVAGLKVQIEVVEAQLPGLTERLGEVREQERLVSVRQHAKAIEAAERAYTTAAHGVVAPAAEYAAVTAAAKAAHPQEFLSVPGLCPFAIDLASINGASPSVRAPPELLELSLRVSRTLAAIRRRVGAA